MKGKIFVCVCALLAHIATAQAHGDIDVVLLGDSNTSIGGDACDNPTGWSKWFKDAFGPASCRSYARSGATWTNTPATRYDTAENTAVISDDNVIYNQVNRLREACNAGGQPEPDLIIIAAGTNDAWFPDKRPSVFGMSVDEAFAATDSFITWRAPGTIVTLAEAVRYCCETLMQDYPDAQIVLLTPLQSAVADAERLRQAADVIAGCGGRMALAVIRQDRVSSVYNVREKVTRSNTYDGTHTSPAGARRNGTQIARMVSAVIDR